MSPTTWLWAQLIVAGVRIRANHDNLMVDAVPGTISPDELSALKRHKPELLRLLNGGHRVSPAELQAASLERSFLQQQSATSEVGDITGGDEPTSEMPIAAQHAYARGVLNRTGVRIMALEDGQTVGIWSDLDSRQVRAAVETLGMEAWPIKYLDEPEIPARYKLRQIAGKPVPASVLLQMIRASSDPWERRDIMLAEMEERPGGISAVGENCPEVGKS
jgi:hypothetical protein